MWLSGVFTNPTTLFNPALWDPLSSRPSPSRSTSYLDGVTRLFWLHFAPQHWQAYQHGQLLYDMFFSIFLNWFFCPQYTEVLDRPATGMSTKPIIPQSLLCKLPCSNSGLGQRRKLTKGSHSLSHPEASGLLWHESTRDNLIGPLLRVPEMDTRGRTELLMRAERVWKTHKYTHRETVTGKYLSHNNGRAGMAAVLYLLCTNSHSPNYVPVTKRSSFFFSVPQFPHL